MRLCFKKPKYLINLGDFSAKGYFDSWIMVSKVKKNLHIKVNNGIVTRWMNCPNTDIYIYFFMILYPRINKWFNRCFAFVLVCCFACAEKWLKTWQRLEYSFGTLQELKCFVLFQWSIFLPSLGAQMVKNLPAVQEILVRSLGQGDPLEKGITTHFSILAWRIPWTEELGLLKCMESQRVRHNSATEQPTASAWERPLLASWLFWPNDS